MKEIIKNLSKILEKDQLITDPDLVRNYLKDETPEGSKISPRSDNVVVKPNDTHELSSVLELANQEKIPVFVRGGATGLVSGCVPTRKGIILSMERLKQIKVDNENLTITAEAGVNLKELTEAAEEENLMFPLHPGDEEAQVGGLVACNAGGARAVKTGVMRNFVTGLEVVLPSGEVIHLGGKIIKDNICAGKLMHLFIGTEGIFGVITKATLKLLPVQKATATIIVPFEDRFNAMEIVPKILKSRLTPQGLEYVERRSIEMAVKELGQDWPCNEGKAYLLIMFSEPTENILYEGLEEISGKLENEKTLKPLLADSTRQQKKILDIRSELYPTLKPDLYEDLDICVPISNLSYLLEELDRISEKFGTYLHPYGHAGDGNLHVHVMKSEEWNEEVYKEVVEEIYEVGVSLGGVITGEHGIGEAKKEFLNFNLEEESQEILRKIKKSIDPNDTLNPGKVIN